MRKFLTVLTVLIVLFVGYIYAVEGGWLVPPDGDDTVSEPTDTSEEPGDVPAQTDDLIAASETGYIYGVLTEAQQKNYDEIVRQLIANFDKETTVEDGSYGLTVTLPYPSADYTDIEKVAYAVFDTCPQFFYLNSYYYYSGTDSVYDSLSMYYCMDAQERIAAEAELREKVNSLLADVQGKSDYEKELFFHDQIANACVYNNDAVSDPNISKQADIYYENSSPYYALCKGSAICGGYSRAYQLLLQQAGIDSIPIYNVDRENDNFVVHTYFNLTDSQLWLTREPEEQYWDYPTCNYADYAYFTEYYTADQIDSAELSEDIVLQGNDSDHIVELRFDNDGYAAALEQAENGGFMDEVSLLAQPWSSYEYLHFDELWVLVLKSAAA